MVGNWNRAVAAGHGELTMLVSQDDELGAGMLAAYTAEFVADPGVVLVSGAEEFIDEDSRPSSHKVSVGHRHNVFVRTTATCSTTRSWCACRCATVRASASRRR